MKVIVLFALITGGVLVASRVLRDPYSTAHCKSVGYGPVIDGSSSSPPPGAPTPEAALAAFAPHAPMATVPADGWTPYRGTQWVRELGGGRFYKVDVVDRGAGWIIAGGAWFCGS